MEAVKLDLLNKRVDNARVGLVLAAVGRTGDFLLAETNEMLIRLNRKWIDGYIRWNFLFVSTAIPNVMLLIGPLISCTGNIYDKVKFFMRRMIAFAVSLIHVYPHNHKDLKPVRNYMDSLTTEERSVLSNFFEDLKSGHKYMFGTHLQGNSSLAASLGGSNLVNAKLANPAKDTVWKMFYTICR